MKSNDLMIWDLVYVPHNGKASHYGRVNALYGSGKIDVLFQDGTSALCPSVEPIPLTPEILEKNGFKKKHPTQHFCEIVIGSFRITVQFGYGNNIDYVRIYETPNDNYIPETNINIYHPKIKYIHNLQHCLKLCGINKEIRL